MLLYEYQTKSRFAKFGIHIPPGNIAESPAEAAILAHDLGGTVIVKAQILASRADRIDGIKIAHTPEAVERIAQDMLGSTLKGQRIHAVLIEQAATVRQNIYLRLTTDRRIGIPVIYAAAEQNSHRKIKPISLENIVREPINPFLGLRGYQIRNLAGRIKLPYDHWEAFADTLRKLFECYRASDGHSIEISPLALDEHNQMIVIDGMMNVDDNARYRQQFLSRWLEASRSPEEALRKFGISYVELDGQIGCIVNGAGLAMTTMDIIDHYGDGEIRPANFMDIAGDPPADQILAALQTVSANSAVRCIIINFFSAYIHCAEIARHILSAIEKVAPKQPIVVRLEGHQSEASRPFLANIPNLFHAPSITEAVQTAIQLTQKA